MQNASADAAHMALQSRAEVQLLTVLHQNKAKNVSGYLRVEQQRVEDEQQQQQKTKNLKQYRVGAGKNAPSPSEADEMIGAVRQLEHHVVVSTPEALDAEDMETPNQIEQIAIRRREIHMEALRVYTESVKTISEEIEGAIIRQADVIKETLAVLDSELTKKKSELQGDALLLTCEHGDVLALWAAMDAICERRTKAVDAFGEQLEFIEKSRVDRVGAGLRGLTKTLMDTAHALPPEVERIIEAEAYELNVVVISNRRAYADLITRMATQDVDVLVQRRLEWEAGQQRWRRLRHDDALQKFCNTITSTLYTDPDERQQIMAQLRAFQDTTHRERRVSTLRSLRDAGADLTSQHVQSVLAGLTETQRHEEEQNASYFQKLTSLYDDKIHEAQQLREALRLELHGFGAMAQEGEIGLSREKLTGLLGDESLEEFFRMAGGLKSELDLIAKKLNIAELIYQANLTPLRMSVDVLRSALPLEEIMENQGKGAERKAVQATLDRMRKAAKHEIIGLLPVLQGQVSMLLNLADTSDVFKAELEDVGVQLRLILQEHESQSNTGEAGMTDARETRLPSPPAAVPSGVSSPGKSLATSTFGTSSLASLTSDVSSAGSIDLHAIRKVQRRLGTLVYASELSPAFQDHLMYIAEQLELQTRANDVVDSVVTTRCDDQLMGREEESMLFLTQIGQHVERQNLQLHEICERIAQFVLRVVQKMEEGEERVRFVNLSVLDLLDTLQENDEKADGDLEEQYAATCARLRHAPDGTVLQNEFENATDLLQQMESSYRVHQKRVALAAQHHVTATHKQHDLFLFQQCSLFGLVAPTALEQFDVERFLSVQCINEATTFKPPSVDNVPPSEHSDSQATGESSGQGGGGPSHDSKAPPSKSSKDRANKEKKSKGDSKEPAAVAPVRDRFHTTSGLELDFQLTIPELVEKILTEQNADEGGAEQANSTVYIETQQHEIVIPTPQADAHAAGEDALIEENEEEIARRQARNDRLQRVHNHVARDFLSLAIEHSLQEELLHRLRETMLTKFDLSFKSHIASASATQTQRVQDCNLLLEERLRMHWPRRGRLDVQLYQPRIGELYSHRERYDRHIRTMTAKVDTLQVTFERQLSALQKSLEEANVKQLTLQAQLPMQQSLAALQGLEVKSKKLLSACRSDSDEKLAKLKMMASSDLATLASLVQDYLRVCTSQVFPDLTSCEVISGCDFHPDEVSIVETKIHAVETKLREILERREPMLVQMGEKQRALLDSAHDFKSRYQSCLQSLSMRDGLGQKYGLPRRTAQERYRSETTRAEELSSKIDELLASLQSIVENKQTVKMSRLPDSDVATQVLHLLLKLRAKLFYRGKYFGLLKNTSQLEPLPVKFDAGGVANRPTITDKDAVDEEYRVPSPLLFLDFVKQVGAKCRDDTRQLYQQEGKLDELPSASAVPAALEEYLAGLSEKARAFVLQHELKFREQVDLFGELLALAPVTALSDLVCRARETVSRETIAAHEDVQLRFLAWMDQKNRNMVDLRPDLCSPNNVAQLQALCEREGQRSDTTFASLRACRLQILTRMIGLSSDFEKELIALCNAFQILLDTSVMVLDDLKPFSGEELPRLQRKSLKRLRKFARIQEYGDPREVKRSDEETKKLTQLNEVPRFPRRGWPAIPAFGSHVRWEAKRVELMQDDEAMQAPKDESMQALAITQAVNSDGACTALLTHAHRCLMHSRDEVYAAYETFSCSHSQKLLADLQERLRDEIKWSESWRLGIDKLRLQRRSSTPASAAAE